MDKLNLCIACEQPLELPTHESVCYDCQVAIHWFEEHFFTTTLE